MSSLLPPGFWFRPSEDQLLTYYLANKNRTGGAAGAASSSVSFNGYDVIRELDLYGYYPSELPEIACYEYRRRGRKRRHWYCYAEVRALAEGSRKAKGGFWVMSGRARGVFGGVGGALIGTKTKFVYYSGESAMSAVKTGWVLYEYALVDHLEASFVLCRVFIKSHFGNSVSENALSPSAEESDPAVHHIGVQHDGFFIPDNVGAKVHPSNTDDRLEKISRDLLTVKLSCDNKLDKISRDADNISRDAMRLSYDLEYQIREIVESFKFAARNNLDTETDKRTPEDDFIELDDLRD